MILKVSPELVPTKCVVCFQTSALRFSRINMKLENESIFFKSTLCDKPPAKASELDDDALGSERSKIETEENHGDINLDNHLQCIEKDENGWNPFKEDSSDADSSDTDDVKAVNVESFENDSEKNVPELIVRDICIDERINPCSSPVKVAVESDENGDDLNDVLVKELEFSDVTMADELKISEGSLSEEDSVDQTDSEELIPVMVVECDENYAITKAKNDAVEEHYVDPNQMSSEIENVSEKSTPADPGPEHDNVTNELSFDAKTEKESLALNEIIISESGKSSAVVDGPSSQIQHGIGETSFSSAAPLASLINYSGPVAYSGNLSVRSDSSTTSTRSFAFPILQTEWHHNSPVRMAEADRRFFRKHKGWRQGLFCCKF